MNTVNLKNTIRDEGSTALKIAYTVKTMDTWFDTFTVLTGDGWMERMGHTLRLLGLSRIYQL